MNRNGQLALGLLSTGFGLLMVAAAVVHAERLEMLLAALAVVAVFIGLKFAVAATLAVAVTVTLIVVSGAPPLFAALSGTAAAAYLVVRHSFGVRGAVATMTRPTSVGIVGFTLVGIIATSVPLQIAWLPLLAPPAVVGVFLIALRPFMYDNYARSTGRG